MKKNYRWIKRKSKGPQAKEVECKGKQVREQKEEDDRAQGKWSQKEEGWINPQE